MPDMVRAMCLAEASQGCQEGTAVLPSQERMNKAKHHARDKTLAVSTLLNEAALSLLK